MSSDRVETLVEPDAAPDDVPFAAAAAEGPFGFKPDRNRPIEPHFDGFGRLTPEQARQVLDVRDGRRRRCVLWLPTESVLVEHCGQGYCDPSTGQQWGYRVRRVGRSGPPLPLAAALELPPLGLAQEMVAAVAEPPRVQMALSVESLPAVSSPPVPSLRAAVIDGPPEPEEEWTAPARSPRATALADPTERAALVRVLVLWFVVGLLLAECVTLLASGR
jgi:hypothetical protein